MAKVYGCKCIVVELEVSTDACEVSKVDPVDVVIVTAKRPVDEKNLSKVNFFDVVTREVDGCCGGCLNWGL